jgi:hypothetical protein
MKNKKIEDLIYFLQPKTQRLFKQSLSQQNSIDKIMILVESNKNTTSNICKKE